MTPVTKEWFVYIIRSLVNDKLYTGVTTDPNRRLREHNSGPKGAKSTRSGRPWKRVYLESGLSKSEALQRELKIKSFPRSRKLDLISHQLIKE